MDGETIGKHEIFSLSSRHKNSGGFQMKQMSENSSY